jgi:hypothetical protein
VGRRHYPAGFVSTVSGYTYSLCAQTIKVALAGC